MWKNGRVGIWGVGGGDAPRGEPLWPGGLRPINFATVSPDGRRALIADHDGGVWLGKIADVQPFGKIATHPGAVRTLGFSHDSLTALSGGHDARVCLWDVADRASLRLTLTHRSQVTAAVFSPNGRLVLTSADDEEEEGCQLWDARLGRRVGPGYQHRKTIDEVALSPDGRTALLGGYDGWAILWRLPEPLQGDVERIACWVKTIVGMELDEGSGRRVLERASWQRFRQRLREPGGVP
jgi:WD40 repeat protein